jgi:glycine/D-amino acid oxidase-like deaminating enzyme
MGCKDVVLLERDKLTSGTTWHAAGLMVTFGSLPETACEMRQYGRNLYKHLEAETVLLTGFTPVGFMGPGLDTVFKILFAQLWMQI